jgi:hypothetical protein
MVTRSDAPLIEDMSEEKEHYNILVYADSGVGKTVLAGSHPKALILAADTGTISAARQGSKAKVIRVGDWPKFEQATRWIRAGGYSKYEWIVLDSLSMLREKCMRYTLESEHARNAARDEFIPAQPDHQKVQNVMKRTVEIYADLPVNVLFTALPMHIETRDGESRVMPMIHGQNGDTAHYIAGLMDSVGYMEVTRRRRKGDDEDEPTGSEVRRIHWQPYNEFVGKDRFGVLAPYTDNLTLPQIEAMISASGPGSPEARESARPARTATRRPGTARRRTA